MPSQHPHGHEYDVFLSYSTRDRDWVRQFVSDLIADVNRFADFDIASFFDEARLQPGYLWDDKLVAAARDSAILVPVLSPRFFGSDYCQKEVKAFVDAHGVNSGMAHRSRIMPVKLLCAAPTGHILSGVQSTTFCAGSDSIPLEYAAGTTEYKEALRKLSVAIAQSLKTLPSKAQSRGAVYLAPDFKPESEKLRAALQHHFKVLPDDPMKLAGLSEEELQQSLARDFAVCFVSVHPLNNAPFAKSLIQAQLEFARRQGKPRLVWTTTPPDDLSEQGFEWFTSPADIEDRIRRLYEKPAPAKREAAGADRLIYFLCPDRANKMLAESLLAELEQRGVYVYPSPLDGPADQALQSHLSALDQLDGCLIYYGDVTREWFDAVFLRVQKKIRQRRLPSAVFVAPPPTPHKVEDLRNIGIPLPKDADAVAQAFLGGEP